MILSGRQHRPASRWSVAVIVSILIVSSLHAVVQSGWSGPVSETGWGTAERLEALQASSSQWQVLPGIGEVLSRRIVHGVRSGALQKHEDLIEVRGIGPVLSRRLKPLLAWHSK